MKNYLSFLLLFSLLSILFGCKEEESNNPTWEPPCSGSFPELTDWSYQPITLPLSNGEYVGGLYFSETGKGVAASFNKIWITENDGQTWQNVYKSPITLLSNVNFTDPDHGFITGEFLYTAYLLITKDAGFNWDTIYFPAFQKFEYCSFADSLRGIAIIRDNHYQVYLAKTKDGGKSWEKNSEITPLSFNSEMKILENGFGYVPAEDGKIFLTEDYAETWSFIETGFSSIHRLQFLDPQTGFVSQYNGMFKTEDGGLTWDTISHYPASIMHFFSKDDGIAVQVVDSYLSFDVVLGCIAFATTHDGGASWNFGSATSSEILKEPTYIDASTVYGIVNGRDFNLVKIYR